LRQSVTKQDYPYYGTDIQQNFTGDFKIGEHRNRVVAGVDFYSLKAYRNDATVNMPAIDYRNPGAAYNNFTISKIEPLFDNVTFNNFTSNNEVTYSAYVSDVFNVTDKFIAMAGVRLDRYFNKGSYYPEKDLTVGDYNQTAFSPRFGLLYQLIDKKLSLFTNYMNGFNNVGGSDFNGNPFKPSQANQWEGGVKLDLNKISATVSYYNIRVTNMTRPDLEHTEASFLIQDGTQISKGFEAELIANPIPGQRQ
jgi:iron complex outermembrane receptor protein